LPGGDCALAWTAKFKGCEALIGQIEEPHLCLDRLAALLLGARRIASREQLCKQRKSLLSLVQSRFASTRGGSPPRVDREVDEIAEWFRACLYR
jgi:hypothetical protein